MKTANKSNNITHHKVNTLYSPIYTPPKQFQSIFKCKEKQRIENPYVKSTKNEKRIQTGVYGPLIVIHKEKVKPAQIKKRSTHYEECAPIKPYRFFQDHANCPGTQYYYHGLLHPKILRHYSPDNKRRITQLSK